MYNLLLFTLPFRRNLFRMLLDFAKDCESSAYMLLSCRKRMLRFLYLSLFCSTAYMVHYHFTDSKTVESKKMSDRCLCCKCYFGLRMFSQQSFCCNEGDTFITNKSLGSIPGWAVFEKVFLKWLTVALCMFLMDFYGVARYIILSLLREV